MFIITPTILIIGKKVTFTVKIEIPERVMAGVQIFGPGSNCLRQFYLKMCDIRVYLKLIVTTVGIQETEAQDGQRRKRCSIISPIHCYTGPFFMASGVRGTMSSTPVSFPS